MSPSKKVEVDVELETDGTTHSVSASDDEIVIVKLPRRDYMIMRDMIEKQKSLNWMGKYAKSVILVFAGGVITIVAFGEQILSLLKHLLGLS